MFAYPAPVDLRKGYDGLYGLVQSGLGRDPLSGELFLFVNLARKLCKVLVWDGTGLCIFQKPPAEAERSAQPRVRVQQARAVGISAMIAAV